MSFNVRTIDAQYSDPELWDSRKHKCAKIVNDHSPDVVGLQEPGGSQAQDMMALTGMSLTSVEGTGIIYNSATTDVVETGEFYYTDTPDVNDGRKVWGQDWFRTCVWALFRHIESDRTFYVYNNHWSYNGSAWMNSSTLLDSRIGARSEDAPFFVIGDLNVDEGDASIDYLKNNGDVEMVDTFREIWPDRNDVNGHHGWSGHEEGSKIDFVLVGGGTFTTLEADIVHDKVDGMWPTDHFPIWGSVEFK